MCQLKHYHEINVGIVGFGTVGSGTAYLLLENKEIIKDRVGIPINLKTIADLDITTDRGVNVPKEILTTDAMNIINDPDIQIVVETVGGCGFAKDIIIKALKAGKNVVTANKELIAKYGKELLPLAKENGVDFMFEASVGGGIPIIGPLKNSLAGNKILEILGIVNGTTNYILTEMKEKGSDFDTVLKDAQAKGYAEANPTADVDGYDASYKLSILSSIAYNSRADYEKIYREGIREIGIEDINYAEELGYNIKLLAISNETEGKIQARVHPTLIKKDHPLASVNGVMNAIYIKANGVFESMYYGPGAGSVATGSAIVGDIIESARNVIANNTSRIPCKCIGNKEMASMDNLVSKNYIRIYAKDIPGCISSISKVFADNGVSLETIIQKSTCNGYATIIWLTQEAEENKINKSLEEIKTLNAVETINSRIRVL
ncbi:MAG: homoserine dehydrogenase [Armatimonadetes bacterium]|nr:homoserine dehydrogenase [Candidatus Hippobium faecium]